MKTLKNTAVRKKRSIFGVLEIAPCKQRFSFARPTEFIPSAKVYRREKRVTGLD